MNMEKEEVFILYKYDPFVGEKQIKGIYKSNMKALGFKKYLEKRSAIKRTKNQDYSEYSIERDRIYIDFS